MTDRVIIQNNDGAQYSVEPAAFAEHEQTHYAGFRIVTTDDNVPFGELSGGAMPAAEPAEPATPNTVNAKRVRVRASRAKGKA